MNSTSNPTKVMHTHRPCNVVNEGPALMACLSSAPAELNHLVCLGKTASASDGHAEVPKAVMAEPEELRYKTFLVEYGTRTPAMDGASYRDNCSIGLVRAVNAKSARIRATELHMPEGLEEPSRGKWVTLESNDKMRRGFELDSNHAEVDAGCVLWIERVVRVRDADIAILKRYL